MLLSRSVKVIRRVVLATAAMLVLASGCSSSPAAKPRVVHPPTGVLRLGYMTGLADAPVLAGLQMGYLGANLGEVTLQAVPFQSAVAEQQALAQGELDAAYIDPVAAVAAWQATQGGIKIIAGAASGGAQLVVRAGITSPRQLAHAVVAAPAGTAQQAALKWWLKQHDIPGPGPGNVTMTAAYAASALRSGGLSAAWEPAPADAQLAAAGGHVLLDEASLWPGGRFPTAVLAVTRKFQSGHAAAVSLLLRGQIQAEQMLATDKTVAQAAVARQIAAEAAPAPSPKVLSQAFHQLQFTNDPMVGLVQAEAQHAAAVGLLAPATGLRGLFDLGPLNLLLKSTGLQQVPG
jgi:NitT/TauT family transport system substrate-binding protein